MNTCAVAAMGGRRLSSPNARNPAARAARTQFTTPSITTFENAIASSPSVINSSAMAAMGSKDEQSTHKEHCSPCSLHSIHNPIYHTFENAMASSPSAMNSSAVAAMGGKKVSIPQRRNTAAQACTLLLSVA